MAVLNTVPRLLVVEARDLDTDARARHEFDVAAPVDEAAQRAQLASVVAGLHPGARMRSFGNGAASFLDASHLVVAHYVVPDGAHAVRAEAESSLAAQPSLFAA